MVCITITIGEGKIFLFVGKFWASFGRVATSCGKLRRVLRQVLGFRRVLRRVVLKRQVFMRVWASFPPAEIMKLNKIMVLPE